MVAVEMDATGGQGCKVKNLRKRRFVSSSKAKRGRLNDSSHLQHHYQIVKSVFGLATNGLLALIGII
jgi:hypothetical protein